MLAIQILLVLFFIFAVIRVAGRYRQGDLSLRGMIMWLLFWLLAGLVVIMPNSTSYFARLLGIGRGADLVVYLALVAIFSIIFRLMVKIEHMNRNITKLVRKTALDEADKEKVS